jgi:predicted nucleotidyltransferase
LIGSLARGDYTALSDANVVVVICDDYPTKHSECIVDLIDPTLLVDLEPVTDL